MRKMLDDNYPKVCSESLNFIYLFYLCYSLSFVHSFTRSLVQFPITIILCYLFCVASILFYFVHNIVQSLSNSNNQCSTLNDKQLLFLTLVFPSICWCVMVCVVVVCACDEA
eukprot:m.11983 g.11983  ORF g.11983 m.11983 type:complete len:112 (-) comp3932_c0_seq2:18-353(-)